MVIQESILLVWISVIFCKFANMDYNFTECDLVIENLNVPVQNIYLKILSHVFALLKNLSKKVF